MGAVLGVLLAWMGATWAIADAEVAPPAAEGKPAVIRFMQFNVFEMRTAKLVYPANAQMRAAASIIRRYDPDVLSINEMQYDLADVPDAGLPGNGLNPLRFMQTFLSGDGGALPYPHWFISPANTGLRARLGEDGAWTLDEYNYGRFPAEYSMALLSKLPVDSAAVKRHAWVRWRELAGNRMPDDLPADLPLFDKDFYDVPVRVKGRTVRVLMLHTVPPIFTAYNAPRNADQVAFLRRYVEGGPLPPGVEPLPAGTPFVIMGDLNIDPQNGSGVRDEIRALLNSELVVDPRPAGGCLRGVSPELCTSLAGGGRPEPNLDPDEGFCGRLDYVLFSRHFEVGEALVHWPGPEEEPEAFREARVASDHFAVVVEASLR